MKKIILASASPRRRELLTQAGFSFEVMVSQADETMEQREPAEFVKELALRKAQAVARGLNQDAVVIGADTIVVLDGEILGKPKDENQAYAMLERLQGRIHQVYTGVALKEVRKDTEQPGFIRSFAEETKVAMYPMSGDEIRRYIATGEPMDKAGAYGIQGRAGIFIKEIQGDYHNVVGLPIARLYQELKSWLFDGKRS